MKGGLSVGMALLDWYGKIVAEAEGKARSVAVSEAEVASELGDASGISGNLLFVTVPDEEGYSAGMRGAVPFLNEVKERFDLEYTALIDLEPASMEKWGKDHLYRFCWKNNACCSGPGRKAHVLNCFHGVSSLGVFKQLFHENRAGTGICGKSTAEIARRQPGSVSVTGKKAMMCLCLSGLADT